MEKRQLLDILSDNPAKVDSRKAGYGSEKENSREKPNLF